MSCTQIQAKQAHGRCIQAKSESALRGGGGSERVLVVRIESIYLLTSGLGNPALLLGTGLSAVSGASQPGFVEI